MPRLTIVHPDGVFTNSQTTENFSVLRGVALGMVRQRAMFHTEMGKDKLKPQCKSSDGETGYPTMTGNAKDLFPWSNVPFTANDLPKDEWDRLQISCKTCPFSQWTDRKTPPRCAERHAYPILFSDAEDWRPGDDMPHRGIVSFQKSGIKPSNQFLTFFKSSKNPVYSYFMQMKLRREKTGMVTYSVPEFARLGPTDREDWAEFSTDLKGVREFLRQPPRPPDDAEGGSEPSSAAVSSVIESTATVGSSAPVADAWGGDDDDLPF